MNIIVRFLFVCLAVMLGWLISLPGTHATGLLGRSLVAVLISVSNVVVKPILILFTIPITILTLGLFLLLVINCRSSFSWSIISRMGFQWMDSCGHWRQSDPVSFQ